MPSANGQTLITLRSRIDRLVDGTALALVQHIEMAYQMHAPLSRMGAVTPALIAFVLEWSCSDIMLTACAFCTEVPSSLGQRVRQPR